MKLNPDCVRAVLLWLEKKLDVDDSGHLIQDVRHIDLLDDADLNTVYYEADIMYSLEKLVDAGYIDPMVADDADGVSMRFTGKQGITFAGHEFLDNIRSDKVWADTKKSIKDKLGSAALSIFSSVAANIAMQYLSR